MGRIQAGQEAREAGPAVAETVGPAARLPAGAARAVAAPDAHRAVAVVPAVGPAVVPMAAELAAVALVAVPAAVALAAVVPAVVPVAVVRMVLVAEMVIVVRMEGTTAEAGAERRSAAAALAGAAAATSAVAVRAQTDTAAAGRVVPHAEVPTAGERAQGARDAPVDIAMVVVRTPAADAHGVLKDDRTVVHVGNGPTTVAGRRAAVMVIVAGTTAVAVAVIVAGTTVAAAVVVIVVGTTVAAAVIAGATTGIEATLPTIARRLPPSGKLERYGIARAVVDGTRPTSARCPNQPLNSGWMKVR